MSASMRKIVRAAAVSVAVWAAAAAFAAPAFAVGPHLRIYAVTPDTVQPGRTMTLTVEVQNAGNASTAGPIRFEDAFGPQVTSVNERPFGITGQVSSQNNVPVGSTSCTTTASSISCEAAGPLPPGAQEFFEFEVAVGAEASGSISDSISASGGGSPGVVAEDRTIFVGSPGTYGFDEAGVGLFDSEGAADVQAATPPADYTTKLVWKSFYTEPNAFTHNIGTPELTKNVVAHLPAGMIGNPTAVGVCKLDELGSYPNPEHESEDVPACPLGSQVGVVRVGLGNWYATAPLYNMVAPHGTAAELGFNVLSTLVLLDAYLRPGDNGIDIVSRDTSTSVGISAVEITVWGVPAASSHDIYRGKCLKGSEQYKGANGLVCPSEATPVAFLRTPTSCNGSPLQFGAEANTYENEAVWAKASFDGPTMTGCDLVPFSPSIAVKPTATAASSPSGVAVKLSLPQPENPEGLQEADLKKAVVTLPEGLTINPSSANGLQACTDEKLRLGLEGPSECPDASKIGYLEVKTPLLENPVEGSIWLRSQNSSDPASGEMFRIALELRDDAHGIDIKVPGQIAANPLTGQLTTTFDNSPQLPFESLTLHFKAGARSPLSTPATCGVKSTVAKLYSWARPNSAFETQVPFEITSGPEGSSCGAQGAFNPAFNAGVTSVQAGAFTPFLTTFSRTDAEQQMGRVTVHMPAGLMGSLRGLPLCGETEANAGTCSSASQIGSVTAGSGVGPTPFYVTGGRVYMTGPYKGAPFGLSIVVPAKAGPFDLGTVVVRAKVEVDPHTAQLTVTTDPLPKIVGGVPVDLRLVNVTIDRKEFTFNPTSCEPMSITGSVEGTEGATANVENNFQVANCATLPFKPKFRAYTKAHHSRKSGAYLHVTLESSSGQANIKEVHVELPKALPSVLKTLQQACTEQQFAQDPAGCPAGSIVGHAKAITPLVPVPIEGPAYFVSHGGAKFPELVMVLQGYGISVILNGETFISKTGVTSSTFKTVPDVPVSRFDLVLPEGNNPALTGNGDLCAKKLTMPTRIVGQNNKVTERRTKVKVIGCKPELRVRKQRSKGGKATILVEVPSAGRLIASGEGIDEVTEQAAGGKRLPIIVKLSGHARKLLAKHHNRSLRVNVQLRFQPKRGHALSTHVEVLMH